MNYGIKPLGNDEYKIIVRVQKNGVRKKSELIFGGTKKQAEKKAIDMVYQLTCSMDVEEEKKTGGFQLFDECVDFYISQKNPKRGDITYIKRLKNELGNSKLNEIPVAFERFMGILARSKTNRGNPYTAGTKNRYIAWLSAIINFCVDNDKIKESPFTKPTKKMREIPRDRSLSKDEMKRLLDVLREYRPYLEPFVMFLLQIPCRKSELLNARREHVNLNVGDSGILRIPSGTTKNSAGINKPIPPNMVEYFKSIPDDCPWAFYREKKGKYYQLKSIDDAWRFCREKAGLGDIRIHDTRHLSATELINRGIPERIVMECAGWKTNMLSTYYHRKGVDSVNAIQSVLTDHDL